MKPRIVPVLLGTTGAGKTALLCKAARIFPQLEVIVCDSRQIYQEMPITTAAPSAEERIVPRHMLEVLSPAEETSAFAYRQGALASIADVERRGGLPILVAGTGFYFRALKSMPGSPPAPEDVRLRVHALTHQERLELLRAADAERFESLPQLDPYRVQRALEIALSPPSGIESPAQNAAPSFAAFYLRRDTAELDQMLALRARSMIEQGMVEELAGVRERYGICPGLRTIGFDLALQFLEGTLSRDDLLERLFRQHRQYAKRQRTWFRKEEIAASGGPDDFETWLRYFVDQDP